MNQRINEYEDDAKKMRDEIIKLKENIKEQEEINETLEDFREYALRIQCNLSEVYISLYIGI